MNWKKVLNCWVVNIEGSVKPALLFVFGGVILLISESLYFEYDGEDSSNFGIMNVHVSTGLFNEPFLSGRSITEHSIRGRKKPYFQEVNRSPKTLNLTFYLSEGWDDYQINAVSRWLNVCLLYTSPSPRD